MSNRRSTDLSPAQKGFAPSVDHLGNSLSDIRAPVPQGVSVPLTAHGGTGTIVPKDTGVPIVAFECYDKVTGDKIIADDRTFDAALHSLEPVVVAPAEEPDA